MKTPIYQVDAFTDHAFGGNPAAVMPLKSWLPDGLLQAIAAENNLAETAFFVPTNEGYHLRWFTPKVEVDLCGHATLATAHVILNVLTPDRDNVSFETKSGTLRVARDNDRLVMDFPIKPVTPADPKEIPAVARALGCEVNDLLRGWAYLAVTDSETTVRELKPDMEALGRLPVGVIVTAKGQSADFVSRFFAPQLGIPEDPVTGAAHTSMVPYWAKKLGKTSFFARQLSERVGDLWVELVGDRVKLAGHCVPVLAGEMTLPE